METLIKSNYLDTASNPLLVRVSRCAKNAHGSSPGGGQTEGRADPGLSERAIWRILGGL